MWLKPEILDAEVKIEGFKIIRQDREGQARGGVAIYIKEDIDAITIFSKSSGSCEALAIKCK